MHGDRGIALLADEDQWARCAHEQTVLLPGGGVGLDWTPEPMRSRWDAVDERCDPPQATVAGCAAGLAHDRWCRAWRSHPLAGTVEVTTSPDAPTTNCPGGLRHPTGVAVDSLDRLYVAESAGRAVMIADLWSGRVLHRVATRGRPVDVVAENGAPGAVVVTASPHRVVRIDGGARPCARSQRLVAPCGHPDLAPARIALLSGRMVVLWCGDDTAIVVDEAGRELLEEPSATDIAATPQGLLVVARGPDESFHRFWERDGAFAEGEPVAAADYDGGAATIDPRGRIVYTTPTGTRSTQGSTARHARRGVVTSYRLDSGTYRTRWGRIFVDACLPTGTGLVIRTLTTDEDEVDDPLPAAGPARGAFRPRLPEATPPLPPKGSIAEAPATRVVARGGPVTPGTSDTITTGPEWTTYETGVAAPPGRYLWVRLEFTGTERTSPRVRAMRIERPGHALLSTLPRMYSSDDAQADFLHRYLAPAEGLLHDLDTAAAERRILVDPRTTPDEFLPWLATFAGVVLDLRWPEEARRALVAEAYALFARRGTAGMLERMLRLYLGRDAHIVERWRLRGLGGAFLGFEPAGLYSPTVSGTARKAGMLGHFTIGGEIADTSSYTRLAHRFTVLIPGCLTEEQREVVNDLILAHKPSHTLGEICEVGSGMPVGRLRLGLTAYVAPPPGRSHERHRPRTPRTGWHGRDSRHRISAQRDATRGGATGMNELRIERMTAAVADWPDPGQVLGMLRHVAESRLDDALREQPLPDGEWCVRHLDVSVDLDPERPLSALEAGWADRIIAALRLSLLDGSSDVVRFVRPEDAVDDLFTGLAAHRYEHAWAWRQVGLIEAGDPAPEEDARGLLLAVLHRMRHGAVGALARLVAEAGLAPVHRLLGADGWRQAALISCRDAGAAWSTVPDVGMDATELPALPSSSGGVRGDFPGGPALAALGARIAASGSFTHAFRSSGLRVDDGTLTAWAVLATAEVDPTALRRTDESVRELTRSLAALLTPERRPGMPSAPRSAKASASADAEGGGLRTATGRPHGTDAPTDAGTSTDTDRDPVTEPSPVLAELGTSWGGLLFLLNTADEAGIPEALDRPPFDARPPGWVLHRITRLLVPAAPDDPAVLAFAGLAAPPDDEPDAIERRALDHCAARWGKRTARRLRTTGTDGRVRELVFRVARRDAAVDRKPGWIEIHLPLADVDLDIRRAGLDLDPGWLPWLGRVVRFRYE